MKAACPSCNKGRLQYVMRSIEWHAIDELPDEDGYVDLFALEDSTPDVTFDPFLECNHCNKQFTLKMEEKK